MEAIHLKLTVALLLCLSLVVHGQVGSNSSTLPAHFIFGDSLVDVGMNNYIPAALAKANFPYNGMDFPLGATGRFCNGRTVADIICDLIGIPYPQPYLAPATKAGQGILVGVNYASAAGGILDATGANYLLLLSPETFDSWDSVYSSRRPFIPNTGPSVGQSGIASVTNIQRVGFNGQIAYFQDTLSQLQTQLGTLGATQLLNNALCTVVIGSNDFINNYLLTDTTTKYQYDTRQYNILLLNALNVQLTSLYNFGFRKFTISNVGPLGCIPDQLAIARVTTCITTTNDQVLDYNNGLQSLTTQLTANLPGSQFLYSKVYDSVTGFVSSPAQYGFTTNNAGCCGAGFLNGQAPCLPTATPCSDRSKFIFWDGYHPTEAANIYLANNLYTGGLNNVSPTNIKTLLGL